MANSTQIIQERQNLVAQTIAEIRQLHQIDGINDVTLKETARLLQELGQRKDLFSFEHFPLPAIDDKDLSTRYELYVGDQQEYALYIQSIRPGKKSIPHNHGTWAVIVAIVGEELNRIYRRTDDGSRADFGQLEFVRQHIVKPGEPITFTGADIHSIHVESAQPALHFHLYGQALETLVERVGFNLDTGEVSRYNQKFWRPSAKIG